MHFTNTETEPSLWIFGYGSLIWNPGFRYFEAKKGHVRGWARRMYQGNTYHRGDENLPGRVATLVEDSSESTCGMLFRVLGRKQIALAIDHLTEREVLNGYEFVLVPVETEGVRLLALTCIAREQNPFYLGPCSEERLAFEIREAKGCAGPNADYVLKLAENVRRLFPEESDDHLFGIVHRLSSFP